MPQYLQKGDVLRKPRLATVPSAAAIFVAVLVAGACGTSEVTPNAPTATAPPPTPEVSDTETGGPAGDNPTTLEDERFAAHYVDSYPAHGDVFARVPERVQIDFDFVLREPSSIRVTRDGEPVDQGRLEFGTRDLVMWVSLPFESGDGVYRVEYSACWPDRTCHDGMFVFEVDAETDESYVDLTGRDVVEIDMLNIKFQPARIVVSKGTRVVWTNGESTVHFLNSDPHPSHNVMPGLNSLDLAKGDTFEFTFNVPGEWGYHCSAHHPQGMVGRVIVK